MGFSTWYSSERVGYWVLPTGIEWDVSPVVAAFVNEFLFRWEIELLVRMDWDLFLLIWIDWLAYLVLTGMISLVRSVG